MTTGPTAVPAVATTVRYRVVGSLALMAVLLYLHRFCLSPIQPQIIDELGVTKEEFGRAVGIFFFGYALAMPVVGWLTERTGARLALASSVALWSLSVMFLGMANSLVSFSIGRLLLGIGQAGAYPIAQAIHRVWIADGERTRANSVVATSGRAGGLLANALTPTLAASAAILLGSKSLGWRAVFVAFGAAGLAWALVFALRFRDEPQDHPQCNDAEQDQIGRRSQSARPRPLSITEAIADFATALAGMFRHGTMLAMCAINILVNVAWIFLATWLPTYLQERYPSELEQLFESSGMSKEVASGLLTTIPILSGMLGNLLGGMLSDALLQRTSKRWARRIPGIITGLGGATVLFAVLYTNSLVLFLVEMALLSFMVDLSIGAVWAVYQDIGGYRTAMYGAVGNMCGNLAAAQMAWQIGFLAGHKLWWMIFAISAASMLMVAVCWMFVDADTPLEA